MKRTYLFYPLFVILCLSLSLPVSGSVREKYNFNPQWLLHVGDMHGAEKVKFPDKDWKKITLPRAFNEDEAFKVPIKEMTDTVAWYRKHFKLPKSAKGKNLTAVARQIKDGKRVCFYEVVVSDELGTEVAFVTINGYVVRDQGEG